MFLLWTYSRPDTRQAMKNPERITLGIFTCLFLGESSVLAYVISQVSSIQNIHHEVQVLSVLESIVHIDYEGIVQLSENLSLVHDWLDASLCNNPCLRHLLHSVLLFSLLSLYLPDLSKASLSNAVVVVEVILRQSYTKSVSKVKERLKVNTSDVLSLKLRFEMTISHLKSY